MLRTWTALATGLLCFGWTAGLCAQDFSYTIEGLESVYEGPSGSTVELTASLVLSSENLAGDVGPQGWSLSVGNSGVSLVADSWTTIGTIAADVADGGLRSTGFEVMEAVDPAREPSSGPLAGAGSQGEGVVQAIVLSFIMPITLPANSSDTIGLISYTGMIPTEPGAETAAAVEFKSGLQGSGQPVSNDITQEGQTESPTLGGQEITLRAEVPPPPGGTCLFLGTEEDSDAAEMAVCATDEDADEVWVAGYIGPSDPEDLPIAGAQGWSIGIENDAEGLEPLEATTLETVAADVADGGVRNTGFEVTEIINPERQSPVGREGLVSAVVLSFVMPITLDAVTTDKVVRAKYSVTGGGMVNYVDGLVGSGQPVTTVLTVEGQTVEASEKTTISIVHSDDACAPPVARFLRGDANNDGIVNIADPIYTINERVRSGPSFGCDKAADSNDDGMVDLSDAMYTIQYRFLSGATPPAPFTERPAPGEQCDDEPEDSQDDLTCDDANCS